MIKWNDPEPMKSGGESQTSTCGRFRLYKSVLGGWSVGYRANEFTPWKPIDPQHGGQTRWHQSRKMALQVVDSFAKQYNGRPLPIPKGATTVSVTREKPVLASPVSSPSNSRRPIMSENESTTTVEESAAVATKPAKKRPAKKTAAKAAKTETKGTKVSPKKKAAAVKGAKAVKATKKVITAYPGAKSGKPSKNGAETRRKDGLRGPQVRVLQALAKGKNMTRPQITEKSGVDQATLTEYIGSSDDETRLKNDAKHFPSLVTLKLVKAAVPEEGTRAECYNITALGLKALEKELKSK